jgi:hypothetical protein
MWERAKLLREEPRREWLWPRLAGWLGVVEAAMVRSRCCISGYPEMSVVVG